MLQRSSILVEVLGPEITLARKFEAYGIPLTDSVARAEYPSPLGAASRSSSPSSGIAMGALETIAEDNAQPNVFLSYAIVNETHLGSSRQTRILQDLRTSCPRYLESSTGHYPSRSPLVSCLPANGSRPVD